MNDIMLDLETLALDNNALVLSIGAVQFDMKTGEVGKTFHISCDILEQLFNGAKIDLSTIKWWSEQDAKAKATILELRSSSPSLIVAHTLQVFNEWISGNFDNPKNVKLWGNGIAADNVWIRNLYKRHNLNFILPYWCDNDVRTITQLEDYNKVCEVVGEFEGTKHDAIDDCLHQIKMCHTSYKLVKGEIE